jgi:hypothetical protein
MPTVKPRIQVTLTPAIYEALTALAKRQSRSRGSIAAEMLNELLPQIEGAYELAQNLRTKSPGEVAKLRRLAKDLDGHNQRMLDDEIRKLPRPAPQQMDLADAIATTVRRGPTRPAKAPRVSTKPRRAYAGRGRRPPSTNRGV